MSPTQGVRNHTEPLGVDRKSPYFRLVTPNGPLSPWFPSVPTSVV